MKFKDYYADLGLPRDAKLVDIKKAYRKLAHLYHPDVSKAPDAEAKFKDAAEAYATLKDPEKRAAYDALGQQGEGKTFTPPPQWQREYANAGAGSTAGFDGMDLADLLASLGRGFQPRSRRPENGQDLQHAVQIDLQDAYRGTQLHLTLDDGNAVERTLEVTVPAGMRSGQKLRLRGKGQPGVHGGTAGDMYLHITVRKHPVFHVDHADLSFALALSPWEAVLGADVEVPTLDSPVLLSVPPGTCAGRKLRLRQRGMPTSQGGRGDLYALVHIEVPATVSDTQRAHYAALAADAPFNPREKV